tara:strand:+ start:231 stop:737 length:507 start_codon:yes stop_codon:yes gene_type:complete
MSIELLNILKLCLGLLALDNAPVEQTNHPIVLAHMISVADAISKQPAEYQARLISLAYNESRFGYRFVLKGKPVKSGAGACGIYQQIPRFAEGGKTTCAKLQDPSHATMQAVAYLKFIERKYKARSAKRLDRAMCHYFSGNHCDRSARAYAKRHRSIRQKASRHLASL